MLKDRFGVPLADADGNGKIEYQEFAAMFGMGDKQAKKRREIAVKIAEVT